MTIPATIVHSDPDILGGTPVFVGTRVPLQTFMEHVNAGQPLCEFLEDFPSVTRAQLVAALQGAEPPRYALGFFFEWGGGVLWCRNEAARQRFDVGPIEERLPLRPETLARLAEMTMWHDTALNWDYPPDPGPWSPEEERRFDRAALEVLATIRGELGPDFEVIDQRHPG